MEGRASDPFIETGIIHRDKILHHFGDSEICYCSYTPIHIIKMKYHCIVKINLPRGDISCPQISNLCHVVSGPLMKYKIVNGPHYSVSVSVGPLSYICMRICGPLIPCTSISMPLMLCISISWPLVMYIRVGGPLMICINQSVGPLSCISKLAETTISGWVVTHDLGITSQEVPVLLLHTHKANVS